MVKGVFFLRKISFIFFLFFSVMSFTFSSFAGVASGSNAKRVPRASWSNASHAWEDFKDSFDRINDVDTVSSFSSDSRRVHMYGLTSDGQQYYTAGTLGTALALPILSSGHYKRIWIDLHKEWLPAAGTYKFYWAFTDVLQNIRSSGVDNVVGDYTVIADVQKNVDPGSSSGTVSVYKSQNLWSSWINIKTSSKLELSGIIWIYMILLIFNRLNLFCVNLARILKQILTQLQLMLLHQIISHLLILFRMPWKILDLIQIVR